MEADEGNNLKGEVTLMYSGGTDSTLAAVYLCEQHRKVTLLTMRPHNFLSFRHKTKILANKLIEKFGEEKITHKYLDARDLKNRIDYQTHFSAIFKYGPTRAFDFCSACGMAMHTKGIIYNLEKGIHYLALGFTDIQGENAPAQSTLAARFITQLAKEYNIEVLYPVFEIRETDRALFELGIVPRKNIQSRRDIFTGYPFIRPTQGSCLLLLLQASFKHTLVGPLFGTGSDLELWSRANIEKENIARRYIKDYFEKKGLNLETLIAQQANFK